VSRHDAWAIDRDARIKIAERVYVSFERTRRLAAGDGPRPPSSYGTAPLAAWDSSHGADLMVAVREDEAIWLGLSAVREDSPCAVRVIVREPREVDAVTGAPPLAELIRGPQNYLVVPPQHAWAGVAADHGVARQFVRTAQSDTDAECHRLQLSVHAAILRVARRASSPPTRLHHAPPKSGHVDDRRALAVQGIAADPYGLEVWRSAEPISVTVEFVAPDTYTRHTGKPGPEPLTEDVKYGGWRLP
jgi:hypothetical protein